MIKYLMLAVFHSCHIYSIQSILSKFRFKALPQRLDILDCSRRVVQSKPWMQTETQCLAKEK